MLKNSSNLFDEFLNIQTEIAENDSEYHRTIYYNYGPTPYSFLDYVFVKYPFSSNDHLVDFGCGKGRVLIMSAYHLCNCVTGYELDTERYDSLQENIKNFQNKFNSNTIFLTFNINVEKVRIDDTANKFFFFSPFHLKVHIRVLNLIKESLQRNNRVIHIFLCKAEESIIRYIEALGKYRRLESIEYHYSSDLESYNYYECAVYISKQ